MNEMRLSSKQEKAVALVLSGKHDGEIATLIGVARKTVNRWRNHDDGFRAALARQREAMREETADALQGLTAKATRVLAEAMEDENAHVRLKAAGLVLKLCERQEKRRKEVGVDREEIERQVVIAALTESLKDLGMTG